MSEKEEFIQKFREVQPKFSRFYAWLLTQADLSLPQFALLSHLANRGSTSMTRVSTELHITKPAVTHLVDRLEKNQFLKRIPHTKDRRVSLLAILPKGERIVKKTQGQVLGFLLKTLDQLNTSERKTITRFYALLSETMDEALIQKKKRI